MSRPYSILLEDFEAVVLNHGICKQPVPHGLQVGLGLRSVAGLQFQLDQLSYPDILNARVPQGTQRMEHRLPLGVQDPSLQGHIHARLHDAGFLLFTSVDLKTRFRIAATSRVYAPGSKQSAISFALRWRVINGSFATRSPKDAVPFQAVIASRCTVS